MPEIHSTLCIYLAAVPGQMDGERAVIEGLVLPELRARAEELGLAVELVDPMKAKGEEWDLAQRFREIDACRPFFLALLGERYGDPPRAVPPDVVAAYPWLAEDPGRSVLELEILHAALRSPGEAAGACFYFRGPRFPSMVPDQHRSRFLPETERAAARLAGLKERIRASGQPVFDGYPCGWSDSLERASRLDALAERMLEDLWPAIQAHAQGPAGAAHGRFGELAEPAPAPPPASPSRDPNATAIAPAADLPPFEDEELSHSATPGELQSFYEPVSPDDDTVLDDTAVAAAPPLDDSWIGMPVAAPPPPPPRARTQVSAPAPPPAPFPAPSAAGSSPYPASPPRSVGRGSGLKIAAVLAVVLFALSIFALRAKFRTHDVQPPNPPIDIATPTTTPGLPQDYETYDLPTWKEMTAACELSGEEISRLPARAVPGATMAEIFATPSAYNARVIQRQLASQGAFLLPRRAAGGTVCTVVFDASQPQTQDYLRNLRTEPRMVPFPRIPDL